MSTYKAVIAAPVAFVPDPQQVEALVELLQERLVVAGTPIQASERDSQERLGVTWTWAPGRAITHDLEMEAAGEVELLVSEWVQPSVGPGRLTCPRGHDIDDLVVGELLTQIYETGTDPLYTCPECDTQTPLTALETGPVHVQVVCAHVTLTIWNGVAPWDDEGQNAPVWTAIREVLGVNHLQFGHFRI